MQVTVIGAANIDIKAKSKTSIIREDSNPADVSMKAGGVARNIAAMLAKYNAQVHLITAVGNDPFGKMLQESCKTLGINTDAWIIKKKASTGVYVAALEDDGELYTAFNATSVQESIKTSEITKHKKLILNSDLLVLDLNLSEKILNLAIELRDRRPIMVDAVSVAKVPRLEGFIDKIDVLKLNRIEAEHLTGIILDTKERVMQASRQIVSYGVKRVFVTLGVAGVCAADSHGEIIVPAVPTPVKDVTGAGDAFAAGIAMNISKTLRTQAQAGVMFAAEHLRSKNEKIH